MLEPGVFGPQHHALFNVSTRWGQALQPVGATTSTTYPTADLAIYTPIRVRSRTVVQKLCMAVNGASGNVDIGLYDAAGVRLVSTGTTAAATNLVVDTSDVTIGPGLYYLACVADNTTVSVYRQSVSVAGVAAAMGLLTQQLGAGGTLPATATWAVNQTLNHFPLLALVVEATIT